MRAPASPAASGPACRHTRCARAGRWFCTATRWMTWTHASPRSGRSSSSEVRQPRWPAARALAAVTSAVPDLVAELDLSGNPMWFRPECKHRHVAEIPTLRRYDDEELTDLDRELAAEALSGGKFRLPRPCPRPSDRAAARTGSGGAAAPAEGSRPSTAPVSSGRLTVPFRLPAGQPSSPTVSGPGAEGGAGVAAAGTDARFAGAVAAAFKPLPARPWQPDRAPPAQWRGCQRRGCQRRGCQ